MCIVGATAGMAFVPTLLIGAAIGFSGAVIGATLKEMMGFEELVR